MTKELKNKPLVEAIMELRWELRGQPPAPLTDPHYKLLLARLFDRMNKDYPEHEQLPAANIPDEFVGHIVQHRFRKGPNQWPLVQVGPGILTINSTSDYTWKDFNPRAVSAARTLFDAHPKIEDLRITNLVLRYIDAVEFNYQQRNAFDFIRDKLKLGIDLPPNLFEDQVVENNPQMLTYQSSFKCTRPDGMVKVRFATGQKIDMPAILWEITVESLEGDLPSMPEGFGKWIEDAHFLTDDWFFKMIAGDLERRFAGE